MELHPKSMRMLIGNKLIKKALAGDKTITDAIYQSGFNANKWDFKKMRQPY